MTKKPRVTVTYIWHAAKQQFEVRATGSGDPGAVYTAWQTAEQVAADDEHYLYLMEEYDGPGSVIFAKWEAIHAAKGERRKAALLAALMRDHPAVLRKRKAA